MPGQRLFGFRVVTDTCQMNREVFAPEGPDRPGLSPPRGRDLPWRGLEIFEPDPDGPFAAAVRREGAGGDPAPDRLDRDRHGLGCLLEAQVDRSGASLSHRSAPPPGWRWRRRGSGGPRRR